MRWAGIIGASAGLWACGGKVTVDLPHGSGGGGSGGSGGAAGSGGAGGSAFEAACDVAEVPPSGGTCVAVSTCNPVTNAGCSAEAGEACDLGSSGFQCFSSGNQKGICEPCSNIEGPFCAGGLTCLSDGGCAHYCCEDDDCGTGFCDSSVFTSGRLGVCKKRL